VLTTYPEIIEFKEKKTTPTGTDMDDDFNR
jgi:hypothetical protein